MSLHDPEVTDADLAHFAGLAALEYLDLRGTQVTDAGLAHLAELPALEFLHLGGTQVSDAGISELQKALPNCLISSQLAIHSQVRPDQIAEAQRLAREWDATHPRES